MPAPTTDTAASSPRAAIASWLGGLFVLLLLLMLVGGYVRLTQSGLSLPGWPFVDGRLLPPMTEAGWHEMHSLYREDLRLLEGKRASGVVGLGADGHRPESLADFKRIFLIEWSHRFLAAVVGIVGIACLIALLRTPELRRLAGGPLATIVILIVVQSVIGGVLVLSHTSTHWLFLHLGLATAILGCLVWTLMLLVRGDRAPLPTTDLAPRRTVRAWAHAALIATFVQIVLGALVAGSRHNGFATSWPEMAGSLVPQLWFAGRGVLWNLLDNPTLHQWVHRWFAWLVVIAVAALASTARGAPLGARARLAIRFALVTTCCQVVLGVINVRTGADLAIALGHLTLALVMFTALCLAVFDLRHEAATAPARVGSKQRVPA